MILLIPQRFQYLVSSNKKIQYKSNYLKVDYVFNLIHRFIYHYAFDKDEVILNSQVLQKIYGMNYLRYIEYLVEKGFIIKTGNYSSHLCKSNKYKMIEKVGEVFVYHPTDFVLNRKYKANNEIKIKTVRKINSSIPEAIRTRLISDLRSITIDESSSIKFINETIVDNPRKYLKNLIMILKISDGDLFFEFDKHGRLHTNFTNLRKGIRNNFLKIDGEPIMAIDIKSSQPLFLAQILKNEWLFDGNEEIRRYIHVVEKEDIYSYFFKKHPLLFGSRDEVKPMMFKCLFDTRKYVHRYKELFKTEFPEVYDFIKNYNNNYGEYLWESLQRMESHYIFHLVYPSIINEIKDIKLFTVHDSIHYPRRYHPEIQLIWDREMKKLINNEK